MKKLLFLLFPISAFAQTEIPLNDLGAFKNPSTNWTIVGGISGDYQATTLTSTEGKGILYGTAKGAKYQANDDLFFKLEHGDIKLSLDFMIPKGSNSGVYLQGRYEVQILDSWLKKEINDLFRHKLDILARLISVEHPEFFADYKSARIVIEKKNAAKQPPESDIDIGAAS